MGSNRYCETVQMTSALTSEPRASGVGVGGCYHATALAKYDNHVSFVSIWRFKSQIWQTLKKLKCDYWQYVGHNCPLATARPKAHRQITIPLTIRSVSKALYNGSDSLFWSKNVTPARTKARWNFLTKFTLPQFQRSGTTEGGTCSEIAFKQAFSELTYCAKNQNRTGNESILDRNTYKELDNQWFFWNESAGLHFHLSALNQLSETAIRP